MSIVLCIFLRFTDFYHTFGIIGDLFSLSRNGVGCVMVSVVDREFEPQSDKTNVHKIGVYCYSAASRSESKVCFAQNKDSMFEWRSSIGNTQL